MRLTCDDDQLMNALPSPDGGGPALSWDQPTRGQQVPGPIARVKSATLAAVTAFIAVNIWTGCPLLALWVGSQAVGQGDLSMGAVGVVLIVLGALEFAMILVLAWLTSVYEELIGAPAPEQRPAWLRGLCAPPGTGQRRMRMRISALDGIVIINVYIAVITLVVWYLFFAPHRAPLLCPLRC